jgi:hypothetical protein
MSNAQHAGTQKHAVDTTLPPSNPSRPSGTPDHAIAVDARHIYLLRDDTTEIIVEEKTMFTSDDTPTRLLLSAKDQVCSHLAQQVAAASAFMGYGVDTRATGAIITPIESRYWRC